MRVPFALGFLLLLAISWTIQAQNCDNFVIGTPAQLKNKCFDTFKYNPTQAKGLIKALQKNFELNSFTKLYASGVKPRGLKVDVQKGLKEISKTKYKSNFDFFAAISVLIRSLNDPHVVFSIPSGYSRYRLIRPYQLAFSLVNGALEAYLESCYTCPGCTSSAIAQINTTCAALTPYIGQRVTDINGQTPYEYYISYADDNGKHPDLGGRFNAMINNQVIIPLEQYYVVGGDAVETLTFDGGAQVKAPIYATNIKGKSSLITSTTTTLFNNFNSFYKFVTTPATNREQITFDDTYVVDHPSIYPTLKEELDRASSRRDSITNACTFIGTLPYNGGQAESELAFCQAAKFTGTAANVIIATIPTFVGADNDTIAFLSELNSVVSQYNATKLVIDVSDNGGGTVVMGYTALITLTGLLPSDLADYYVAKKGKAAEFYLTKGKLASSDAGAYNDKGKSVGSYKAFYNAGSSKLNIEKSATFTKPFGLLDSKGFTTNAAYFAENYPGQTIPDISVNPATQILFVTNGLCSSTCSIFLSKITRLAASSTRYRVVQYGGIPNEPFDTSDVATNLLNTKPSGLMSIPFRPMKVNDKSNGQGGTLRQFARDDPNYRVDVWRNSTNLLYIYSKVIDLFN